MLVPRESLLVRLIMNCTDLIMNIAVLLIELLVLLLVLIVAIVGMGHRGRGEAQ